MDSDDESVAQDSAASEFEYDEDEECGDVDVVAADEADDDPMVIEPPEVRKAPYQIMNRAEIIDRQMRCINDAMELLDVTNEEAFVLLREYSWDLGRLQEDWFENEQKVRDKCGLGEPGRGLGPTTTSSMTGLAQNCPICMQPVEELVSLDCNHGFCRECWRGYLHTQVDDGKAAVQARCPQHKCGRVVPTGLFRRFCDDDRNRKYDEWYLRSYVDENPSVKWCPSPGGCLLACEYSSADPCEMRCPCGFVWCWSCQEEAHRPAACKTVEQWNIKNNAESENISWIRANTKKCPKCHKPIEKNQGCNHMICSRAAGGCRHEFCWLCLGDWSTHGTSTGGYYQCNIYDKQAKDGKHAEEEKQRQRAKHALDKYMFYFERFMDHDRGMKFTVKEEADIEGKVQTLHDKHGFEIIELQFLYDALRQVRACRRVLKWTYVYGYYMEESGPEKPLFEYLQKNLEMKTDNLHEMLEKDLDKIFFTEEAQSTNAAEAHEKFKNYRSHVTNFTNVTQKFMAQILQDLGNPNAVGNGLLQDDKGPAAGAAAGSSPSPLR